MRRVLVIDDEMDIREVAALSLEATAGWEIVTASSGAEGIRLAEEHKPDAILMDVMMPGMNGPDTFRAMQDNPLLAHIPVILLTAKVRNVDRLHFAELPVQAILSKPFDPMTLAREIATALDWRVQ